MVTFPGGVAWPSLGIGTWRMGEAAARRPLEIAALRTALDLGYRVIDTAEMYGEGGAEKIVGSALSDALRQPGLDRSALCVVSKVLPQNATARGTVTACERSLKRLGLDQLDAYLLHWRGAVPLAETVGAFEALQARGLIHHWGVSNFDVGDLVELFDIAGGSRCAINQVYYSLTERGPAYALLPWHAEHGIATMAYSPIDQGALACNSALRVMAAHSGATPAQMALAWLQQQAGVMAIPKASTEAHLRENIGSRDIVLSTADLQALDDAFVPPTRKTALAMI